MIPSIETERLTLRAPQMRDFDAYADFRASPRAVHVGGPFSRAAAFEQFSALIGQWHLRGFGRWLIADRQTDAPLGVAGLYHPEDWPEPEVAWSVFEHAEGRGIAFEAATAARAFAYDTLGWTSLISLVVPENTRSVALAERLGCTRDGIFRHETYGEMPIYRHPAPEILS